MDPASGLRVGSVVIDCNDFPLMLEFWSAALGYRSREAPEDDWVVLVDPTGRDVNGSLSKVPEPRVGKNRLHLDLYSVAQAHDVERLVGLGAKVERERTQDADFVLLSDPEGNLFCVVDKAPKDEASESR
jgi:predicted enzyme related to lactoylglutathione lyase